MRIVVLLALTSIAHADPTNELTLGAESRGLHSASAEALTGQSYFGGVLSYAHRLQSPVPKLALWATAGFDWGGSDGEMFQTLTTSISSVAFTVGGRASYALHSHLAASARLDLGAQHASLDLSDGSNTASDAAWGTLATAAVALDLFATDDAGLGLGLRAEFGYTVARGIALAPKSPHDDTELQIMTTGASIGHLDLGGPSFTISAVTRF
jgi:hypothetical protein